MNDKSNIAFIIKLGKKEHLMEILDGVFRFTKLRKYQEMEIQEIGDKLEGTESIFYPDENIDEIYFDHPVLDSGKDINIAKGIKCIVNNPDNNCYILCLSYFTLADVECGHILDNKLRNNDWSLNNDWSHILLFKEDKDIISILKDKLSNYNFKTGLVKYYDRKISQDNLGIFSKSTEFQHQREIRIAIKPDILNDSNIQIIDENTISIDIGYHFNKSSIIGTEDIHRFILNAKFINDD